MMCQKCFFDVVEYDAITGSGTKFELKYNKETKQEEQICETCLRKTEAALESLKKLQERKKEATSQALAEGMVPKRRGRPPKEKKEKNPNDGRSTRWQLMSPQEKENRLKKLAEGKLKAKKIKETIPSV